MNEKRIEIIIKKDGSIQVEAFGYSLNNFDPVLDPILIDKTNQSCINATKFLEALFGVQSRKMKDNFFEQKTTLAENIPAGYCG